MQYLLKTDPTTAKAMKNAHRGTTALLQTLYEKFYEGQLPTATFNQFYTTVQAIDRDFLKSAKDLGVCEDDCRYTQQELENLTAAGRELAAKAERRATTTRLGNPGTGTRLGNTGTVLCISLGEIDRFHVDSGDYPRHPSVLFCTQPAILHVRLEHQGAQRMMTVPLAAGDAVGFSASQFLHKLVRAPGQTGRFVAFTAWTEAQTVERARQWNVDNFFVV